MAKINGETIGAVKLNMLKIPDENSNLNATPLTNSTSTRSQYKEKFSASKYFKEHPKILVNLICMILVWCASSFCYYLISYQLKYIQGDIFINNIVSSTSELVAYGLSGFLLSIMGLKKVLISSFCLSFIGMLFLIINGQGAGQFLISLYVLGSKFGISSTFNMAYLGNPMLFPTEVLSISFGACNIFARVSTILAPFCGRA